MLGLSFFRCKKVAKRFVFLSLNCAIIYGSEFFNKDLEILELQKLRTQLDFQKSFSKFEVPNLILEFQNLNPPRPKSKILTHNNLGRLSKLYQDSLMNLRSIRS